MIYNKSKQNKKRGPIRAFFCLYSIFINMKELIKKLLKEELEKSIEYPKIPDLVYHGQAPKYDNKGNRLPLPKIDTFNLNNKRFLRDEHIGFYFSPSKREATDYAEGGYVYTCNLNIKNPYYYEPIFHYNNQGLIRSANFITKEDMMKLISNGYDGVVLLENWIGKTFRLGEIIAFYPEQIKILDVNPK